MAELPATVKEHFDKLPQHFEPIALDLEEVLARLEVWLVQNAQFVDGNIENLEVCGTEELERELGSLVRCHDICCVDARLLEMHGADRHHAHNNCLPAPGVLPGDPLEQPMEMMHTGQ